MNGMLKKDGYTNHYHDMVKAFSLQLEKLIQDD